ncbi:MAG TPA: glycosyltransferase family 4 protein [Sedimentisphaerales bacterium]|nr:glycosyltransferase family 4 protein [Sedimentisphaerales bacterium]
MAPETVEKKPVRPALIISERTVYEYSVFLEHLLAGLSAESIPAALVCRPDCNVESVVSPLVEVVRHPVINLPFMGRQNRRMLVERLEKFRPTVLHCLFEDKAKLTRRLAQQMDLPYVLTVNSLRDGWRRLSISDSHCAKVLGPARSITAKLAELYPSFAERIGQINVGTFAGEQGGCFPESGRLATMVTTRPLDNVDDFEKLFNAVKHLVIDGYEFLLLVVGGGRAETEIRKLLRALGLLWIVTIVPRLTAWRAILAAGDIFIQPQPSAVFDPLLLEAMGVGAAVAGCKGGVDDLIIEDKTCVVFDPNDELSIYKALQRLLDRREFARQLAKGAQQYLRENHSVSKMVIDIVQTYRDAEQWYKP